MGADEQVAESRADRWSVPGSRLTGSGLVLLRDGTTELPVPVDSDGSGGRADPVRSTIAPRAPTATATTLTTSLSAVCTPDGLPVVDTDGPAGLSGGGGPISIAITGPNPLTIDNVKLIRLVP